MRLLRPLRPAPFKPALPILDWQKPLTRAFAGGGLWFLTEGGGTVLRNLVSGAVGTLTGGLGSWGRGRHGPVVGTTTTSITTPAATLASDGTTVVPTGPCTILMAYRKRSGVFADTGGIGLAGSGGDAGSRCGAHLPWSDGIVYWDYGGLVDGVTELAAPGLTFGDDLWAFTVGPRGMEIWQNGRLRASNTSNPTRTAGAAAFALGAHATTYTDHAEWSFAAIARTQLSSATLAQLTNLPAVQSRLLWEPLQRYWFPLGGPQFARPNADTSTGTWTDQAGGSAALYAAIDEASIAVNDADYLQSALSPASDAYTAALTSVTDPAVSTGHIVRYRYRKDAAGGDAVSLVVTLKQGATTIATWTHSTVDGSLGWATAVQTLTAAQADAITDYATLSLQFTASSP